MQTIHAIWFNIQPNELNIHEISQLWGNELTITAVNVRSSFNNSGPRPYQDVLFTSLLARI